MKKTLAAKVLSIKIFACLLTLFTVFGTLVLAATAQEAALCQIWIDPTNGAVVLFEADGSGEKRQKLNAPNGEPFEWELSDDGVLTIDGKETEWKVEGNKLTLDGRQYTLYAETDTTALENAIDKALALKQADYTSDSWEALMDTISEALDVNLFDQTAIDEATRSVEAAVKALIPVNGEALSEASSQTPIPSTAATSEETEEGGLSTTVIVVIVSAVLIIGSAIAVTAVMIRRKKST